MTIGMFFHIHNRYSVLKMFDCVAKNDNLRVERETLLRKNHQFWESKTNLAELNS